MGYFVFCTRNLESGIRHAHCSCGFEAASEGEREGPSLHNQLLIIPVAASAVFAGVHPGQLASR